MRKSQALIAALVFIFPVFNPNSHAQVDTLIQSPRIAYSDTSKLIFVATPAKWSSPRSTKYQWLVGGKPISGATKLIYRASSKEINKAIQFQETTTDSSPEVVSSVIGRIGYVIINTPPRIEFKDDTRNILKIFRGLVSPKESKVKYQWYRGFIDIEGQSKNSYKLVTSDQGAKLSVNASYSAKGLKGSGVNSNEVEVPLMTRNYAELWREDFNLVPGSSPDPKVWTSENGDGSNTAAGGGWGNRERQFYVPSLAQITQEGTLRIQAIRKGAEIYNCYYKSPCEWISSKYITKEKLGFKYGRIEARIKGPVGSGTWGAFWMLGADIDTRPWPWCGEIDVTELVGKSPNLVYGYLHGLLSGGIGGRGSTVQMENGFAEEFHTYAIDWLPDQINWYVDGILYGSQAKVDRDWVFDHEFYLILNLAMGGNLGGPIQVDLNSAFMEIDWIRFSSINGIGEIVRH